MCNLLSVTAQDNYTSIHQYDSILGRFYDVGSIDSFLIFSDKKQKICQESDSLTAWLSCVYMAQEALYSAPEKCCTYTEKTLEKIWRQPKTEEEALALLDVYIFNGYMWWRKLGNLQYSMQAYNKAHTLSNEFPNLPYNISEFLYKPLANHYVRLGDNQKAISLIKSGIETSKNTKSKAGHFINLGIAYWNMGELQKAKQTYSTGLTLPDVPTFRKCLLYGALANTELSAGNLDAAIDATEQAQYFLGKAKNEASDAQIKEEQINIHHTKGNAYMKKRQFSKASKSLLLAQKHSNTLYNTSPNRIQAKIAISLTQLHSKKGELLKGIATCNDALNIVLADFKAQNLLDLPNSKLFYAENSIMEALALKADICYSYYQKSGKIEFLQVSANCHELAWQAEMKLRNTLIYNSSKIWIQGQIRQREIAALTVYDELYKSTKNIHWAQKAFSVAERSKAILLLESLQDRLTQSKLGNQDTSFLNLLFLQKEIGDIEAEIGQKGQKIHLLRRLDSLQTIFTKKNTQFRSSENALPNIDWFDKQNPNDQNYRGIQAHEGLITYFLEDSLLNIFVHQRGQELEWYRKSFDRNREKDLFDYLACFKNRSAINKSSGQFLQLSNELWTYLIPKSVQSSKNLCIVPDRLLGYIPFDALLPNKASSISTAKWAIYETTFRYTYSYSTLLRQLDFKYNNNNYFLGFAPLFLDNPRGLNPLPEAEKEWSQLSSFSKIRILKGKDATKPKLLEASTDVDILHLATHASAYGAQPRIECIDTSIWLSEIYALDLSTKLVVLSACETGLGAEMKGEGVFSLARAFTAAGAQATLSSLWEVSDASTAQIFQSFYQTLEKGKTPAYSIRKAKLDYLQSNVMTAYKTPYYWSAITFVGANESIPANSSLTAYLIGGFFLLILIYIIYNRPYSARKVKYACAREAVPIL